MLKQISWTFFAAGSLSCGVAQADVIDDIPVRTWYEVPNSRMSSVDPCPANNCAYSGTYGQSGVIIAWSGGAYDTQRDRFIVFGGGHAAYAGNEVYVFDLATLQWSLAIGPSTNVPSGTSNTYPDGRPRSRHTYGYIEYVPVTDRFIVFGGSGPWENGGGGFTNALSAFNFATGAWEFNRAPVPGSGSQIASHAVYDPVAGRVWYLPSLGGNLHAYNPASNTWSTHTSTSINIDLSSAVDTTRHHLMLVGQRSGSWVLRWDLDTPNAAMQNVTSQTSGDKRVEQENAPGFQYDPVTDQYVGWAGGSTVYTLHPDTLRWTAVTAAGGANPGNPDERGTYGRFRYVPSKNVFILVNSTDSSVFIYRLSDGTGTARPRPPTAFSVQ
jgi:hypothetical protein